MQRTIITVFFAIIMILAACQPQPTILEGATSMPTSNNNASEPYDAALNEYLKLLCFDESLQAVARRLADVDTDWANLLNDAYAQAQQGDSQEAIRALRMLADNADLEIGVRLWAWNGLRELGVTPTDSAVYGYVIEVPIVDGAAAWVDTLAAYDDGRVRYINGQVGLSQPFIWEVVDTTQPINQQAIQTIELAQATLGVGRAIPEHLNTEPLEPRITLLTFNGLSVIEFSNETYTQDVRAMKRSRSFS
jgi:hypothetical protein